MNMLADQLPNFLIAGSAKAGTTALYAYLKQHPEIFMSSEKEPHFFAFENAEINYQGPADSLIMRHMVRTKLEDYGQLFTNTSGFKARGEASAMYLYIEGAAESIQKHLPNVKIIFVLRNPVDRAYSSFLHLIRDGRESEKDFFQALKLEEKRIADNWMPLWHYKAMSLYYPQLKRYFELFDKSQLQVFLYDELKTEPEKVLKKIYAFLDVDQAFLPELSLQRNVSGVPKNKYLQYFLSRPNPVKELIKPLFPRGLKEKMVAGLRNKNVVKVAPLQEQERLQLEPFFREDILKTQQLIGQDLTQWLVP